MTDTAETAAREALDAIAEAFDRPRDRYGRLLGPGGDKLRKLARLYKTGGGEDTMDQARLVALAVLSSAPSTDEAAP